MLNIEKYKERIKQLDYDFALCEGELEDCQRADCEKCKFVGGNMGCCKNKVKWLLEEYKEPILTDEEKIIIKDIIKAFEPFGKELSFITKKRWQSGNRCYLKFEYENDNFGTLTFITDKSFKGMGINQGYTLEELGLC